MDPHPVRQRRFPAAAIAIVVFILCIVPGQFWVAKQFPALSGLVQISPSVVFIDIPVQLPVSIDLILAPALFFIIYPLVVLSYPSPAGMFSVRYAWQKVRGAFAGFFAVLIFVLLGASVYALVQPHIPTQVQTGINSFGFNADIHLVYPKHEVIYLRGSLILFVCFVTGMIICIRKISKEPKPGLTREQRMSPYERMLLERRMKEKQGAQQTQRTEMKIERPPVTMQAYNNASSRFCYTQPVRELRPEALYYMPA
jgi:hypothetical protein